MILFICCFVVIIIAVGMYVSSVYTVEDDEDVFKNFKAELKIDMCSMHEYLKHQQADNSDITLVGGLIQEIDSADENGIHMIEETFRRIELKYA